MMRNYLLKLLKKLTSHLETHDIEKIENKDSADSKVIFCEATSEEDIYKNSESIDDFIKNLTIKKLGNRNLF